LHTYYFLVFPFDFTYRSYHWCFHRVTYGWQYKNERDTRRTETYFGDSGFTSWSIYANGSTIWEDWSTFAWVHQLFLKSHNDSPIQPSSVADYYASFTELANQSYELDDSVLLDCFIGGLIPELKRVKWYPNPLTHYSRLCHLLNSLRKNFTHHPYLLNTNFLTSQPNHLHKILLNFH